MGSKTSSVLDAIKASKHVSADDVLALRRAVFEDGAISADEAELLFAVEASSRDFDPAWPVFFIEALTDYTVHQAAPEGYVSVENAEWLIARILGDGVVRTATELDLVVKIASEARWVPETLTRFALDQVKLAVLTGEGAVGVKRTGKAGVVTASDVELLRRILYAAGGDGNIAVTRSEAEVLFDINDATVEAANDVAWSDLFVKAIANHLMAAAGFRPPAREEALRREAWLEERGSVTDFFGRMVGGGFKGIFDAYSVRSSEDRALARLAEQQRQIILAEEVTQQEATWLADRIGRDGVLHENERALLRFLKEESPELHPALKALMQAA